MVKAITHVGLLLAAGAGTRFGGAYAGAKLDYLIDGIAVGVRAYDALAAVCEAMVVVVRDPKSQLAQHARTKGAHVLVNETPSRGLGSSLALGAKLTAENFPNASFLWAYLADMPFIKKETLLSLAQFKSAAIGNCHNHILRPRFVGKVGMEEGANGTNRGGHPVMFGRAHWGALSELHGDVGAQAVIAANRDWLIEVETDDDGVWRDIDSPADVTNR